MSRRAQPRQGLLLAATSLLAVCALLFGFTVPAAAAESFKPIAGAGSTWSANAIGQWISDVAQSGMKVSYAGNGSSDGRQQFLKGTVDFAASDIPFQTSPDDGSQPESPTPNSFAYVPVTAGGTVFMYNLTIDGHRVTNLRLSGENITKIFTGVITNWSDPALAADNPGLTLPNESIVPVVRSDGSGSTAQFTLWMISQFPSLWSAYCNRAGRAPACGETSYYPTVRPMVAQSGDNGVAGYISQGFATGSIGYVEYSYALNAGFPVAKMLNPAGYYTEPTPENVAVSLLAAKVDTTDVNNPAKYLTQDLSQVYTDPDPRTYPLSSYSYLIIPTKIQGSFSLAKGYTLSSFMDYAMCQGQQESASLGYSPMPVNLVQAAFAQITKIPGAVAQTISIAKCNNPTFSSSGVNLLAQEDPQPQACDKQGTSQCSTGTGGARTSTPVKAPGGGVQTVGPTNNNSTAKSGAAKTAPVVQTPAGQPVAGPTASTSVSGTPVTTPAANTATASATTVPDSSPVVTTCDPNTGVCGATAANNTEASNSNGSGVEAAANPAVLAAATGWSSTQTLMVLAGVLLLALILLPGIAARYVGRRK